MQELLCLLPALVFAQSQFVEWGPPHGYKPEGCCATKRSYGIYEEKWQKTEFECRRQCEQTPKCQAYEHSAIKIRALAHAPIARCELHSEPIDHTVPCATAGFHFPVCYVKLTATRPILPPAPSPLASPAPPPRFRSAVAALRAYPDQLSAAKMDAWRAEAVLTKAEDALAAAPAGDPAAVKLAKEMVVAAESAEAAAAQAAKDLEGQAMALAVTALEEAASASAPTLLQLNLPTSIVLTHRGAIGALQAAEIELARALTSKALATAMERTADVAKRAAETRLAAAAPAEVPPRRCSSLDLVRTCRGPVPDLCHTRRCPRSQ